MYDVRCFDCRFTIAGIRLNLPLIRILPLGFSVFFLLLRRHKEKCRCKEYGRWRFFLHVAVYESLIIIILLPQCFGVLRAAGPSDFQYIIMLNRARDDEGCDARDDEQRTGR